MNNELIKLVIIGIAAYFMGNINPAIIIGRLHGIDIRKEGSGNAGMTNTIRVIGLGAGIAVFIIDVLKAFIAVQLGFAFGAEKGAMVAFGAVVIGHCFPVIFGFKGGKGVAASLGAALALNWMSALAAVLVAGLLFLITRRMSVASLGAAVSFPVFIYLYQPDYLYFAIGAAVFLVIMHAANIARLAKGEEKPLTIGGKKDQADDEEPDIENGDGAGEAEADEGTETVSEEIGVREDPLTEEELEKIHSSGQEFADLESGESHIAADATRDASLVGAQTQEAIRPEPEPVDYYSGVQIPDLGEGRKKIAVIGNGSFGTAMANLLTYNGHEVTLYGRNKEAMDYMRKRHMNDHYLPYVILSDKIELVSDLKQAVRDKDIVVFAVPTQKFREVSGKAAKHISDGAVVVNLAKGIEKTTLKRLSEIAAETLPGKKYVALSGPSHAEEIVRNLPAGVVVVSEDEGAAKEIQDVFMSDKFRVYTQEDMIGVEIAGAVKNVIAITTGISDGMKLGSNARAALMTRAIHEIKRLGNALGADPETFSGLSGIGDLIVTCSTNLSRNRRCGLLIGLGLEPEDAVRRVGSVVEGYYTADAVVDMAEKYSIEMPICDITHKILKRELSPEKALEMLMSREKKNEII